MCFDDDTIMRLYRQTIEDFGLYAGQELTDTEMKALQTAAGKMSAKMRAMRIISASGVSKKDLEQRLIHKGESASDAKSAVQWLSDMDLLDDEKMAAHIVRRCVEKGYGINRAKQALFEKQIPKVYWEDALADYPDQSNAIYSYLQAHLDANADMKGRRKVIDALIRRGHSYPAIRREMEKLFQDMEEFPEEV